MLLLLWALDLMQNGTGYPLNLAAAVQNLRATHTTPVSAQDWPMLELGALGPTSRRNAGSCRGANTHETISPGPCRRCPEGLRQSVTVYNQASAGSAERVHAGESKRANTLAGHSRGGCTNVHCVLSFNLILSVNNFLMSGKSIWQYIPCTAAQRT